MKDENVAHVITEATSSNSFMIKAIPRLKDTKKVQKIPSFCRIVNESGKRERKKKKQKKKKEKLEAEKI